MKVFEDDDERWLIIKHYLRIMYEKQRLFNVVTILHISLHSVMMDNLIRCVCITLFFSLCNAPFCWQANKSFVYIWFPHPQSWKSNTRQVYTYLHVRCLYTVYISQVVFFTSVPTFYILPHPRSFSRYCDITVLWGKGSLSDIGTRWRRRSTAATNIRARASAEHANTVPLATDIIKTGFSFFFFFYTYFIFKTPSFPSAIRTTHMHAKDRPESTSSLLSVRSIFLHLSNPSFSVARCTIRLYDLNTSPTRDGVFVSQMPAG